jgi:hypothetical protein
VVGGSADDGSAGNAGGIRYWQGGCLVRGLRDLEEREEFDLRLRYEGGRDLGVLLESEGFL